MAKKAKRRGRPPGSKNKASTVKTKKASGSAGLKGMTKRFAALEVIQMQGLIGQLQTLLTAKVQQQKEFLESQLAGLQVYAGNKAGAAVRAITRVPNDRKRAKPPAKYQSQKTKSLKWTGRGLMPRWMVDEMKGTKLTKEDFLIK